MSSDSWPLMKTIPPINYVAANQSKGKKILLAHCLLNKNLFDKRENFWPWAFMKATRPKKVKKTRMAQNAQNCPIWREIK